MPQSYQESSQSRKWLLTINNPETLGLDHSRLIDLAQRFHPDYFCMADEIATTGTYHTHLFLYSHSPMRFKTVQNRFVGAHIDKALGSVRENRDYIRKEGKWAETDKVETRVEGTFYEFGTPPTEAEEKSPKMYQLLQDVEDGLDTIEIIRENPGFGFKSRDIDHLRNLLLAEPYRTENRDVKVHYIYGDTGTGKTRDIFMKHPAKDICRITNYDGKSGVRFDAYHAQPVLVFEEFHSQIPIGDMLNYLDRYPLMLPARYHDLVACYTTVYITSNIPLEQQYPDVQRCESETWQAFLRRINTVTEYCRGFSPRVIQYDTQ